MEYFLEGISSEQSFLRKRENGNGIPADEGSPPVNDASVLHWTENGLWRHPEHVMDFGCSLSPLRTSVLSFVKYGYKNCNTSSLKHCYEEPVRFIMSCA